jgi:uncharacterized protein (DUF2147 family)
LGFHLRFIVMRCLNIANCSGSALVAAGLLLGFSLSATPASAEPKEVGIWYDDTGRGAVKIEICTPTTLCAKIYWLKEKTSAETGKPLVDRLNPEPSMRNRPICGLPVMGDLVKIDSGFDNGWIYDPKAGKSYSVALDLVDADTLKVTGYKGMRFLGKSFIWTRAPVDLPSCEKDEAAIPPVPTPVPAVRKKQVQNATATKKAKNETGASKLGAADVAKSSSHKKKIEKAAATQPPPVASN